MTAQPVDRSEVLDIAQYERVRPDFRQRVMAAKDRRRVRVGEDFTFLFENHDTVLYQVQEMLRVERIVDEKAIHHEVETYNELIPPEGNLGATLLIEFDRSVRDQRLRELPGLQHHVWLEVGDLGRAQGKFDTRQFGEERVSSVQYLQFFFNDEQRRHWRELGAQGRLKLVVDHPAFSHETVLSEDTANALGDDMGAP